jgi:hypothetical protein
MCAVALERLREEYVDVDLVQTHIEQECNSEEAYKEIWTAVGKFTKVDRWLEGIFEDLADLVTESADGYFGELKDAAYSEIRKGRDAVTQMRRLVTNVIFWCRKRTLPTVRA